MNEQTDEPVTIYLTKSEVSMVLAALHALGATNEQYELARHIDAMVVEASRV
jgi:hypothetical protein